jgi:hypothetical protein
MRGHVRGRTWGAGNVAGLQGGANDDGVRDPPLRAMRRVARRAAHRSRNPGKSPRLALRSGENSYPRLTEVACLRALSRDPRSPRARPTTRHVHVDPATSDRDGRALDGRRASRYRGARRDGLRILAELRRSPVRRPAEGLRVHEREARSHRGPPCIACTATLALTQAGLAPQVLRRSMRTEWCLRSGAAG